MVSADSGLDSIPRYDVFHPGASRRVSKWLSSPSTRPSTCRIPTSGSVAQAGRGRRWRAWDPHGRPGRDCPARYDPRASLSRRARYGSESPARAPGALRRRLRASPPTRAGVSGPAFMRNTTSPLCEIDGERSRGARTDARRGQCRPRASFEAWRRGVGGGSRPRGGRDRDDQRQHEDVRASHGGTVYLRPPTAGVYR